MKWRDCNFESMSTAELWEFYTELGSKMAAELKAEATLLQQRLDELQRRASISAAGGGKRKHAGVAKFRNPHPPFQTWSGRGTQPRWMKDALERGATMDSLRVKALVPSQGDEEALCNFGH